MVNNEILPKVDLSNVGGVWLFLERRIAHFLSDLNRPTVTRREVGQRITEFTLVVDPERCHFLLDIRPGVRYGSCSK